MPLDMKPDSIKKKPRVNSYQRVTKGIEQVHFDIKEYYDKNREKA